MTDNSTPFASCATAADVADVLDQKADDSEISQAFATAIAAYAITVAGTSTYADGAYTISNLNDGYYLVSSTSVPTDGAYTRYILKLVGDSEVDTKSDVPSVDKNIIENNNEVKVNDVNIGDTITYELTATLPSNYGDYDTYYLAFHDTFDAGIDAPKNFTVKVGDTEIDSTKYNLTTNDNSFVLTISDLKTADSTATKDSKVTVTYESELNSNAVIGGTGNVNTVYLEYSNNPNKDNADSKGKTPDHKVVTFTYELDITKVDSDNTETKLAGAEFTLKNADGKFYTATASDGVYKVTGLTADNASATTFVSDANGSIKIQGLDVGTYTLTETKAPDGYNLLSNSIEVVISATYQDNDGVNNIDTLSATVDNVAATTDKTAGTVSLTVENNSGSILPSTGGIGTTIFYIAGGLLIVAAAIMLIVRKHKKDAQNS